jgi:opacity protein-like surface antigen
MKKLILCAAIAVISISHVTAQSPSGERDFKISIGAEGALPLGKMKDFSSMGIGGSLQAEYKIGEVVAITLDAGYLTFSGKTQARIVNYDLITLQPIYANVKLATINQIPVMAGARLYFTENLYVGAQAGITFFSASGSKSSSAFTYAPGIGYNLTPHLDLMIKYQAYNKSSITTAFLGARLAYSF